MYANCFLCVSGASLSGWRWEKCVRCATCLSCSSPSRQAARIPLSQYSSLCLGLRMWCSRLKVSLIEHYSHKTHCSSSHLYRYSLVWVCRQTRETELLLRYSHKLWICTSPTFAFIHKKDFLISVLTDHQLFSFFIFFADNEEELMKKKFCYGPRSGQ